MGKSIKHREKLRRLAEPGTTITTIGPIRVCLKEEFRIGKGSEGTSVYVGLHEDGSEVAVKRVLINSPKCLKANLTEKEILSLLQVKTSQHIVNYRYLEYENPFSYLILDLCEETLEEYVKEHDQEHLKHHGPVIIRDILTGLFALHHGQRKKILHLDLKPQNILVDSEGRMRLSDFGISRILNEEQTTLQTGRKGTRGWMAAESIPEEGNKVIKFKRKSDIQVVGMISFYVLTKGKHPFGDFNYRVQHIIEGNPVNLQQLSNPLARSFVAWMISHNIEDRPYAEDALKHAFLEKKPEVGIVIDDGIPPIMQSNFEPRKYFFVKLIGCGSCGKVYLYETKDRLQNCAVKQVDLTMNDRQTELKVKDLKNEIQILKKLKHNNIVVFYLYEETAETLSMFMEYVPGGSVSDYVMKNGEIEENLVRKYTYQILKGCEYLHRNNVIHRDIKGGNVLIDNAKGSIRLAGFGIAKDLQRVVTSTSSTTDESFRGTIYWCSPEHLKREDPTYVFDIWSVGCTVVEMLTTRPPHRHLDYFQAMYSILNEVFHPPDHLTSLAKTFIELCFKKKEERPGATELLINEFPAEYVSDAHYKVDQRIDQDTIQPTMESLHGVLEPRKYCFVKQIGCGSCGKVYLYQTNDRLQNYAVKQVDLGANDRETQKKVKDVKKEIQMLKTLKHNNIVPFYFYEETVQTLSIFMEYVPGGSVLDYVMKNGEMEENLVRKYTYQILKGCEYLHRNNVIHRDIKGGNVLIDDANGSIRLADFGNAKDLQRVVTSTDSTTDESFRGTIYWCSPEHLKEEDPTYVFDIWSVGCTVVEMLTTKPPHRDLDFFQAMHCILNEVFYPPDHLSLLAKTFIELCFKKKGERPNATELLKNEFPAEYMP